MDTKMEIGRNNIEFLKFMNEELQKVQESSTGFPNETEFRELIVRLRNLLHKKESTLERYFSFFKNKLLIIPHRTTYLYTIQNPNTAKSHEVAFMTNLKVENIKNFISRNKIPNSIFIAMPFAGDNKSNFYYDSSKTLLLNEYLLQPILAVENAIINRWQLISYLSNKKGLAHFDDTRNKKWQQLLDRYWNHILTIKSCSKEKQMRAIYEIAQNIAYDIMNIPHLKDQRELTVKILNNVNLIK